MNLICNFCKKEFVRNSRKKTKLVFCSTECHREYAKSKTLVIDCGNCGKSTTTSAYQRNHSKSGKIFCSRSCAAVFTNKFFKKKTRENSKRTRVYQCRFCQLELVPRKKVCEDCKIKHGIGGRGDITFREAIYREGHRSSAHALIRTRARAILKVLDLTSCQNCGYSKHVEACHIKAVKDFSEDTLVSEINSLNNLVALCPNCHWEFDNGLIELKVNCASYAIQLGLLEKITELQISLEVISNKRERLENNPKKDLCVCGGMKLLASLYCKECSAKINQNKTKIDWPSLLELEEMLSKSNYLQVGKKLGVSDNAIRKHIKSERARLNP